MKVHVHTYVGAPGLERALEDAFARHRLVMDRDSYLEWGEPMTAIDVDAPEHLVIECPSESEAYVIAQSLKQKRVPVDVTSADDWSEELEGKYNAAPGRQGGWWEFFGIDAEGRPTRNVKSIR